MKEEMGFGTYCLFVLALILIYYFIANVHTIFPVMDYDEYFVDKYGTIHTKSCPIKDVPWFTRKHDKYYFIKEKGQTFCDECISLDDERKMNVLHHYNIEEQIFHLRMEGVPKDRVKKVVKGYADSNKELEQIECLKN